jgi:SWI/SNF-related matrix-associated actin-dependent regulator of chromatin subfamily A member 5
VQVFRLVTDETVEVKVVERAQQKLKLDAMVVQQGRLADKEKKMSKEDLLDTLRFGADKIFRTKDSTISDADIDIILEQGKKRTEEIKNLTNSEKGDMYDFRLDGGMTTQVFEGKDYSNKTLREAELNALACLPFIDPGKRERKAVATYAETIARMGMEGEGDKKPKIPRHLRLTKMEDWQFYDRVRLNELHNEELRLFDALIEKGEAPSSNVGKLMVLPQEQHDEKTRLLAEAFGDWTRVHYNNFIRGAAKFGRTEYDKVAKDVGRPVDEVRRYAEVFWDRGSIIFPPAEWEKVVKQVEKVSSTFVLDKISCITPTRNSHDPLSLFTSNYPLSRCTDTDLHTHLPFLSIYTNLFYPLYVLIFTLMSHIIFPSLHLCRVRNVWRKSTG